MADFFVTHENYFQVTWFDINNNLTNYLLKYFNIQSNF